MDIESLSNNMIKPRCLETMILDTRNIKSYFAINAEDYFNVNAYIRIQLISNENDSIQYDPVSLINYFNSFDYFSVAHWDDNKEYDFSLVTKIDFIFKLSDEFFSNLLERFHINGPIDSSTLMSIIKENEKAFNDVLSNAFIIKLKPYI